MFRWETVTAKEVNGENYKMYCPINDFLTTQKVPFEGMELDNYAFKYLQTELLMYKVMQANATDYLEQRGDLDRVLNIIIPTSEKTGQGI